MTARNFSLSKRLIESYTSPGCGRAFDRQPRLTGASEPRNGSDALFSSDSIATSTAAWKATVLGAPPCSSGAVANNSNLLTPDVIASSQQDRVVSCAGKDHALITKGRGSPSRVDMETSGPALLATDEASEDVETDSSVSWSQPSREITVGLVPTLPTTFGVTPRIRSIPFNAIGRRI